MTRHWADTAALRVIHRMKADENMRLAEYRKREHNGSGWENRFEAERRIRIFTDMIQSVEAMADE